MNTIASDNETNMKNECSSDSNERVGKINIEKETNSKNPDIEIPCTSTIETSIPEKTKKNEPPQVWLPDDTPPADAPWYDLHIFLASNRNNHDVSWNLDKNKIVVEYFKEDIVWTAMNEMRARFKLNPKLKVMNATQRFAQFVTERASPENRGLMIVLWLYTVQKRMLRRDLVGNTPKSY